MVILRYKRSKTLQDTRIFFNGLIWNRYRPALPTSRSARKNIHSVRCMPRGLKNSQICLQSQYDHVRAQASGLPCTIPVASQQSSECGRQQESNRHADRLGYVGRSRKSAATLFHNSSMRLVPVRRFSRLQGFSRAGLFLRGGLSPHR